MSGFSKVFTKDPDAILDYAVNWARWLKADSIVSSQWIVTDGITAVRNDNNSTIAQVWLSGGEVDKSYFATSRITTAAGRKDDRTIMIRCKQR